MTNYIDYDFKFMRKLRNKKIGIIDYSEKGNEIIISLISKGMKGNEIMLLNTPNKEIKHDDHTAMVCQINLNNIRKLIIILPIIYQNDFMSTHLEMLSLAKESGVERLILLCASPGFGSFFQPFSNVVQNKIHLNFSIPFTLMLNVIELESIFNIHFLRTLSSAGVCSSAGGRQFNFLPLKAIADCVSEEACLQRSGNLIYHLTSATLQSFEDMAGIASKLTGTKIRNIEMTPIELIRRMHQSGASAADIYLMVNILHQKIGEGLFEFITDDAQKLTNNQIKNFDSFTKSFLLMG